MVSFTALVSAISMALLSTTISAAPVITEERSWPPPTSSVLDFTLFKATAPGDEGKCWSNIPNGSIHVAPADLVLDNRSTACNKANFYVAHIDSTHTGYDCSVFVYDDDKCNSYKGYFGPSDPCDKLYTSYGHAIELKSWRVSCTI